MNALEKALARLQKLLGELNALEAKDQLTVEDLKALEDKQGEIEACEAAIATLQKSEAMRARAAKPAQQQRAEGGEGDTLVLDAMPAQDMKPDQKASLLAAATLKSKVLNQPVLKILSDNGYAALAKILAKAAPAPSITTQVASVMIPTVVSSEIIEMLRPETTFFQGNPKKVKFTHGKFTAPRGASGAVAGYVGEGGKKPVTGPTFDAINMQAKKLAGIVTITQEARDWSLPDIEAYIRDDLRAAMSQAIDLNAYFGTGATDAPTGILMRGDVVKYDGADYVANPLFPTITEIDQMASRLILSLTLANIGQSPSWAWLMNYRTLEFLKNLRVGDDTGVYAYPELRNTTPTWKGFRVLVTNQVPINGGATTDESMLALIDFRHVLFGEEEGITVRTSDQASLDINGTLVHLWQQNMDAILMETQHDFGLRHSRAVTMMDHIRWGAEATGSP